MSSQIVLIGKPAIVDTFSGLRTIIRKWKVQAAGMTYAELENEAFVPYGTADAEFPLALMTDQRLDPVSASQSADVTELTRQYKEFEPNELVAVGGDQFLKLEDGRTKFIRTSVCRAQDAVALAPAIGFVEDGRAVSDVKIQYEGVGATVVVTYTSAGILNDVTNENYNGRLIYRTLTYYNEVPPTPVGYVLVDKTETSTAGVPTYTYRFAKGDGEISRTTVTRNNGGLSIVSVRHLTAPDVNVNPITVPGGGTLLTEDSMQEADGHRIWTKTYAYGFGRIGLSTKYLHNGRLIIRTVRYLNTDDGVTPAGYLIEEGTENGEGYVSGYAVYAEGEGQISVNRDESNNGKLIKLRYQYLSHPDVVVNPITGPGGSWVLTDRGESEESGYKLWTATYVSGSGRISTSIDSQFNGDLIVTRIRYLSTDDEDTPVGALIDSSSEEADGYVIYSRTYASGVGEISRSTETRSNGKITQVNIRYLSAPATVVNPIASPGGSYGLVESGYTDANGYKIWNSSYALGSGRISSNVDTKYNGALVIERIRYMNTDDGTPPDGYKIEEGIEQGNGYVIKSETWAFGVGEISRDEEERNNGKLTVVRIRHLTQPTILTTPITAPIGHVRTDSGMQEADGYRIWTDSFAKGSGRISIRVDTQYNGALVKTTVRYMDTDDGTLPDGVLTETSTEEATGYQIISKQYAAGAGVISIRDEIRNNGQLLMRTIRKLGSAPDAPAGYLKVSSSVEQSDGYVIYNDVFAKGQGLISQSVSRSYNNKLISYRKQYLSPSDVGVPPSTPDATIGGTVNLVDTEERQEEGYILYNYRWAEGNGIISIEVRPREDGLQTKTYVSLGVKMTPFGVAVRDEQDELDGVVRYTVTCMQGSYPDSPPSATTLSFERFVPFTYPGRAKAYSRTVSGSGRKLAGVFYSPPIETEIRGTMTITYVTSSSLASVADFYTVKEWATTMAQFIGSYGRPVDVVKGTRGYRSVSSAWVEIEAPTFPNPENPGGTIFGDNVYGGTTGKVRTTGGPPDPVGNTYTLDARLEPAFQAVDGTMWFRKTLVSATIPAQAALPAGI